MVLPLVHSGRKTGQRAHHGRGGVAVRPATHEAVICSAPGHRKGQPAVTRAAHPARSVALRRMAVTKVIDVGGYAIDVVALFGIALAVD
jgi:hypothetical protein